MKKLLIPFAAAALAFSIAPAWADDSEVRTEQRIEQKRSPLVGTETTRSVESRTETDDGDERSAHSVQREEKVEMGGLGTVQKKTEQRVETSED